MSSLNVFTVLRFLVYLTFGIGLPSSAMILGVFLPYSRQVARTRSLGSQPAGPAWEQGVLAA
jgi:hypothetical protein